MHIPLVLISVQDRCANNLWHSKIREAITLTPGVWNQLLWTCKTPMSTAKILDIKKQVLLWERPSTQDPQLPKRVLEHDAIFLLLSFRPWVSIPVALGSKGWERIHSVPTFLFRAVVRMATTNPQSSRFLCYKFCPRKWANKHASLSLSLSQLKKVTMAALLQH